MHQITQNDDQAEHLGIWNQEMLHFQVNWVTSRGAEKKNHLSNTRKYTVNKIMHSRGLDSSSGQTCFTNRQVSYDSIFPKHTDQRHSDTQTL